MLPRPATKAGEHRKVGPKGFLVTGGDAAEQLEPIDAPLDEIAPLVGLAIIVDRCLPVFCCIFIRNSS
jgi:hypothetical protein